MFELFRRIGITIRLGTYLIFIIEFVADKFDFSILTEMLLPTMLVLETLSRTLVWIISGCIESKEEETPRVMRMKNFYKCTTIFKNLKRLYQMI